MNKLVILFSLVVFCLFANAQITRVQHFNAHCSDQGAKELFSLFNKTFGLPVVYHYQSFGSFASGGLWLGNITFEFVGHSGQNNAQAIFKGVSLEPLSHTDTIIQLLDARQIAHDPPEVATMDQDGRKVPFYTLTYLKGLTTDNRKIFVCDYADRVFINGFSLRADSALKAHNGGPLGIVGLKTILIGVTDIVKQSAIWASMPGIRKIDDHLFSFSDGPDIMLQNYDSDCVIGIIIKVKSKDNAATFLRQQHYFATQAGKLMIDPANLHGLRIILEQ